MECPVCLQSYALPSRVPQVLNCGHTFCSICLEQVALGARLRCPTCREETTTGEVRLNFALRDALLAKEQEVAPPAAVIAAEAISCPSAEELQVELQFVVASAPESAEAHERDVLISLVPPDGRDRTPSDICCVVDVSTSMGTEAMAQDGGGVSISHGLALMDIVKHALRTIVHILGGKDRLSIVTYSDSSRVVLEPTPMTEEGRRRAELRLNQLQPDGMTNLWSGLEAGVKLLSDSPMEGRLKHVLLLTDGIPNHNPPRGIVPMLKRLKDKSGGSLPCTVSTFGFGYELDSELLNEISDVGCGSYAFIPDAGFVGTIFVNAVTNLLVTMGTNAKLFLEPVRGASLSSGTLVPGGFISKKVGQGVELELASLQFGQSKDVIIRVALHPDVATGAELRASLEYRTSRGEVVQVAGSSSLVDPANSPSDPRISSQNCRLLFVDGVSQAMKTLKQTKLDKLKEIPLPLPAAQEQIKELEERMSSLADMSSEAMEFLLEDLSGQVAEALSREEWYMKWGVHYLPSLLSAHRSQQRNNFKDPGVQHYGGELFDDLLDKADEVFCGLEAPKPQPRPPPPPATPAAASSVSAPRGMAAAAAAAPGAVARAAPVVSMSAYYDRCAG